MPKYFNNDSDLIEFVWSELLATLEDDLNGMQSHDRDSYTDEDRETMQAKIDDIREYYNNRI